MAVIDVIKYEGDNTTFVWKHDGEDFNTMSQLIVHQSQEAIFFRDGEALDSFGPGRHTLKTQNIPLLTKKLFNKFTDEVTPFHAEVYFVNLTEQMAILWGLDSKVIYTDPTNNNYPFSIGARGEMSLKVSDARKLVIKLVGTENNLSQTQLSQFFRAPLMTQVKAFLPQILRERQISIFELDAHLAEFSDMLRQQLFGALDDYGVSLQKFWITQIMRPEDDATYRALAENRGRQITAATAARIDQEVDLIKHQTDAAKRGMDSDAERYARYQGTEADVYDQQRRGYSYAQQRSYDTIEAAAKNEGSGSEVRGAAMGLGMGFGMGGAFGSAIGNIASTTLNPSLLNPQAAGTGPQEPPPPPGGGTSSPHGGPVSPGPGPAGFGTGPAMVQLKEEVTASAAPAPIPKNNAVNAPNVFCESCGAKLEADASFCADCGASLEAIPVCQNCGFAFKNQKPFCPKCGAKREDL